MELNLKTETKESLLNKLNTLEAQSTQSLQNAVNIANFFGSSLDSIGRSLETNPLFAHEFNPSLPAPKFNIFWLWKNREVIFALIREIIEVIKNVRAKIEELRKSQNVQPTDGVTAE